jgi:hypothetical protein
MVPDLVRPADGPLLSALPMVGNDATLETSTASVSAKRDMKNCTRLFKPPRYHVL